MKTHEHHNHESRKQRLQETVDGKYSAPPSRRDLPRLSTSDPTWKLLLPQYLILRICVVHTQAQRKHSNNKTTSTLNPRGSEGEACDRTHAPRAVKTTSALELTYCERIGRDDRRKTHVVQNTFHQQSPHIGLKVCVRTNMRY